MPVETSWMGVGTGPVPVPYSPQQPHSKKRGSQTVLWGLVAVLAAAIVATAIVVPIVLSGGGRVVVRINRPVDGEELSSQRVDVRVEVTNPGKVSRVGIYVDGVMQDSLEAPPFEARVSTEDNGQHELKAAAYDSNGKLLAEDRHGFEKKGTQNEDDGEQDGGRTGDAGGFKVAVSSCVSEAKLLDARIKTAAQRINDELGSGRVSAALLTDVQAICNKCVTLSDAAADLKPPADMKGIQSDLSILVGYLGTRADALVKGCALVNSKGGYMAEFDRGAAAKKSFDAGWQPFLDRCRSLGIKV